MWINHDKKKTATKILVNLKHCPSVADEIHRIRLSESILMYHLKELSAVDKYILVLSVSFVNMYSGV